MDDGSAVCFDDVVRIWKKANVNKGDSLVIIADSCHSGHWVEMAKSLPTELGICVQVRAALSYQAIISHICHILVPVHRQHAEQTKKAVMDFSQRSLLESRVIRLRVRATAGKTTRSSIHAITRRARQQSISFRGGSNTVRHQEVHQAAHTDAGA
jgi:hypothetical protein